MERQSELYRPFMLFLLIVCLWLAYLVLKPFMHTIILSFLLGSIVVPIYEKLLTRLKGRRNTAAAIVVIGLIGVIFIPMVLFISALVNQAITTISHINEWLRAGTLQNLIQKSEIQLIFYKLNAFLARWGIEEINPKNWDIGTPLITITRYIGQFIISHGKSFLSNIMKLVIHLLIMVVLIFYVIRDHQKILKKLKDLSPLKEEQEDRILNIIKSVAKSAILGNFATALSQGIAGGIGFYIIGIPPIFWGTMIAISSLIPVIGTAIVWIPTVIYLLIAGKIKLAIFFALWSTIVVGTLDNVIRPLFMKGAGEMSTLLLFMAIMGGVQYFGLLGIIYGPLILGSALVLIYIYEMEFLKSKTSSSLQPNSCPPPESQQ
ncbi:MAG: AI-2E family transporter [Syntrophobacterales bacterium]|nr:AI-2E family transporter [Syntrophobacterales bacterium]